MTYSKANVCSGLHLVTVWFRLNKIMENFVERNVRTIEKRRISVTLLPVLLSSDNRFDTNPR